MVKKSKWMLLGTALLLSLLVGTGCAKDDQKNQPPQNSDTASAAPTDTETKEPFVLAQDGVPEFTIIYPRNGGTHEEEAAQTLKSSLSKIIGKNPKVFSDVADYNEDDKEIYIGNTTRTESEKALSEIGYGDFIIKKDGNKIIVNAYSSSALENGVKALVAMVREASTDTLTQLPADIATKTEVSSMLNQIPKMENKTPRTYCVCENLAYTLAAEAGDRKTYEDYLHQLGNAGYTQYTANEIAGNLFATYLNDQNIVNISYFPEKKALHVSIDGKDGLSLPDVETHSYKTVAEPQMMLLGVSEGTYDNGMSIFFRLSDGRFIVYDGGGADGTKDVEKLYTELKKSADAAGVKDIVIAAWIITHAHEDHITAYNSFLRSEYLEKVTIENFIISPTSYEFGTAATEGLGAEAIAIASTQTKSPETKIIFAHTGQKFTFADTTIEVLFTLDAIMPYDFTAKKQDMFNAASIISKVYIGGKTVMMTGDAYMDTMNFIADIYGNHLKSDILQVPHHGVQGGTVKAYDLILPEYLVWPAGPKVFGMVTSAGNAAYAANRHLLVTMGLSDKKFLAGKLGTVTEIPLT